MVSGDERYERLQHQSLFLRARGLTPPEMEGLHRQLSLLERLAGKDPSKFDPGLVDRLHGELEKAAMEQLKAKGLVDEWLVSWERRSEIANVHAPVPSLEDARPPAPPVEQESTANVDGNHALQSLEGKLAELEHAVAAFQRACGRRREDGLTALDPDGQGSAQILPEVG